MSAAARGQQKHTLDLYDDCYKLDECELMHKLRVLHTAVQSGAFIVIASTSNSPGSSELNCKINMRQ
jgi:hypothetical protein